MNAVMAVLQTRMRQRHSQRGAVLVEVAIILPILMMISLAVFELGMGWKASITVSSSTRAGARVISNLGRSLNADQQGLLAASAALRGVDLADVERVVVFRARNASATVPSACLGSTALTTGGNTASQCNVYSGANLANLSSLSFSSCSARHRFWCPTSRINSQAAPDGLDWVGVHIKVNKKAVTRLFGARIPIEDTTIMRIEPNAGNG